MARIRQFFADARACFLLRDYLIKFPIVVLWINHALYGNIGEKFAQPLALLSSVFNFALFRIAANLTVSCDKMHSLANASVHFDRNGYLATGSIPIKDAGRATHHVAVAQGFPHKIRSVGVEHF